MSTKQERIERAEQKLEAERSREAAIRKNVIHDLGRPMDLQEVQVRPLWENNYRVNVFVGTGAASAKVAHSFFLTADANGEVLASTPAITRLYSP
jgi:hypothetical protein